jgi:hypothetical protein
MISLLDGIERNEASPAIENLPKKLQNLVERL